MNYVTITDHNTLEGSLEIAHLPFTFISEEVTAYFPEDRCKVHVLVYNISEKIHQNIQYLRENIYDLTGYLHREKIAHSLAHPFYAVNEKLTIAHFERLLLLFKNFELNGSRGREQNHILRLVLTSLTPQDIQDLSEKYGIEPEFTEPWKKNFTGGSDDHSALTVAHQYTEMSGANTLEDFFSGIHQQKTRIIGHSSTPLALAHTLYSIAYQFYLDRFKLNAHIPKDLFLRFLHRFLSVGFDRNAGILTKVYDFWSNRLRLKDAGPASIQEFLRQETFKVLAQDPDLLKIFKEGTSEEKDIENQWFSIINQVSNRAFLHLGNNVLDQCTKGHLFNLFQSLGAVGSLYALLSPYFYAFSNFSHNRHFSVRIREHFLNKKPGTPLKGPSSKVAHFTDTFYEINGVALTLRQQAVMARKNGKELTIITCDLENKERVPGVKNFKPVGSYDLPYYQELKLFFPPFLEILSYCYEEKFTTIHSATPGPIGLAALSIARILKLPVYGTYHTALPQYAQYLTDDKSLEEWMWKYILWYYQQMNRIYVPSKSSAQELIDRGIDPQKIRLYARGVNLQLFHPGKRKETILPFILSGKDLKLLYVGRVSKEKNLSLLSDVFIHLSQTHKNLQLIIVGDGPYLEELQTKMRVHPCVFTGYLTGESLAEVYASSDVFIFPSETDTFGNVVLEAQASGLPVVVADRGGPKENILPGKTGIVVQGDRPEDWVKEIANLISNPESLKQMGLASRRYMEERSFEEAFLKTWDLYETNLPTGGEPWALAS
jgi:glycosyltransferase involved in cell wall biosynthesis